MRCDDRRDDHAPGGGLRHHQLTRTERQRDNHRAEYDHGHLLPADTEDEPEQVTDGDADGNAHHDLERAADALPVALTQHDQRGDRREERCNVVQQRPGDEPGEARTDGALGDEPAPRP